MERVRVSHCLQILDIDEATQFRLGEEFQAIRRDHVHSERSETESPQSRPISTIKDPLHFTDNSDLAMDRNEIHCEHGTYRYEWFTVGDSTRTTPRNRTGLKKYDERKSETRPGH